MVGEFVLVPCFFSTRGESRVQSLLILFWCINSCLRCFVIACAQAFQQLQQNFVAFMLTLLVHFIAGIRPILLLQIFSTPYNFIENRLFRKYILGLQSGYRVWGEMFDGELEASQIPEGSEAPDHAMAAGAVSVPEGVVVSSADGTDRSVPVATVQVVQVGNHPGPSQMNDRSLDRHKTPD